MRKTVVFVQLLAFSSIPLLSLAQRDLPVGERFYGTWVKKDSGIVISEEGIKQVYKDEGRWLQGGFSKGRSYYADTTVRSAEKVWEGWDISYYTYLREYLTNGTEQSIEAVDIAG